VASQIEKDSTGSVRGGNLRPEIIIVDWKKNYRERDTQATQDHIAWLKESIRQEGVKKAIDVSYADGKWYLEAGYCRITAAQQLREEGWDGYIPCFQVKGDEATILAWSIIDNTGLPPTLLELGKALQQLLNWNWPMERVAKCVPPSITTDPAKAIRVAKKALDLNAAPLAVKQAVKEGIDGVKVSEGRAVAEAKKNPLTAAQNLATAASRAKAKGETTLKREKGQGKAGKAKAAEKHSVEKLIQLADALADVALDLTLDRGEVVACAEKYNKAKGR
jgi:hypothetical protein